MVKINQTNEALEKDDKYIWHSMKPYNPDATMVITKAEGSWITDNEGNKYLDAMSGLWCVNIGYGRTELADAAYEQLKDLAYYPLTQSHLPAIKLGEKLNEILGEEYVIFFSNSGSEANETAFKIVRQYHQQKGDHQRYKFISRYRAYHGNSMGALAATGQAERKYKYEPLAPGFIHVTPPDSYRSNDLPECDPTELESVKEIDRVMTWEMSETVAGVIMEPIITGGGVIMPPDGYLTGVKEVCEKHGALLIVDEVICGFGRTGEPFGFMNYGVKPDIITMAKGITSGYLPLSATAVRKEIYDSFKGSEQYDYLRHVNTFGGNPASCALALKNLEMMEKENLYERSKQLGAWLKSDLINVLQHHPYVGDVRGKGLLIGIELVTDKETKEPIDVSIVNKVIASCKKRGVIIGKNGATVAGYNNVLTIAPPLNIEEEDLTLLVQTLKEALNEIK
ncbi:aspartate aminotransferase family protein [Halalkalibacter akibai]|uniref:Adenosylmethionine-8-amino-7-oxononanoate aminotransferase n=1 Tax=Halalkalibacter akibai (strain ATCC 43226 / DSM 21942 / CIP 109018 / JCM 9157 / 1139) TaxID=1236973 RepID=W4QV79_HALA3|nr:aspartate aminotransferase family protein [Halalkalibacter akibai]GAE35244.1 adenosylmethionine-8-amino-7-oxononanoate aminotransferase [Halalkalibacter akibai JCM 9157]